MMRLSHKLAHKQAKNLDRHEKSFAGCMGWNAMGDLLPFSEAALSAFIGATGGLILGLAARLGRFCTLGAIEDYLYLHSDLRLRIWGLAIGAGICGVAALSLLTGFEPESSALLGAGFNPLAHITGGLMFGYGMALAGNCGYGAVARLGGGDLRNFVIVAVVGVSAYFALSGPGAYLRVLLFPEPIREGPQTLPALLSEYLPLSSPGIALIIGLCFCAISLASSPFLRDWRAVLTGLCVALAVTIGWAGTHWLNTTGFSEQPIISYSFASPVGETLLYLMLGSALELSFGVGAVMGVLFGAFLGAIMKGQFRWEACDDPRELRRQLIGACLMGVGAVIALGCSIGQGLSAMSLLSFGAPLTLASILIGAVIGLRQMVSGFS